MNKTCFSCPAALGCITGVTRLYRRPPHSTLVVFPGISGSNIALINSEARESPVHVLLERHYRLCPGLPLITGRESMHREEE